MTAPQAAPPLLTTVTSRTSLAYHQALDCTVESEHVSAAFQEPQTRERRTRAVRINFCPKEADTSRGRTLGGCFYLLLSLIATSPLPVRAKDRRRPTAAAAVESAGSWTTKKYYNKGRKT